MHVFAEGQQTVELTVTDRSGLSDTASATVTVIDTPATVHAGPDQTVPESQTVFVSASLFDPGIYDQHSAQIDWGDGSPAQPVPPIDPQGLPNGAIIAGHSYAQPGLYEVTVSVTDIDNGAGDADTLIVSYGLATNPFGQEDSPIFSNLPSTSAHFGFSVDIEGDIAVMGAIDDDDTETDQGAAYVFQRNGTNWDLVQRLLVPEPAATDQFGWSAAISGSTIVVSARLRDVTAPAGSNHGAAFVFETPDGGATWEFVQELAASDAGFGNPFFGLDVDIDGNLIVVGSPEDDEAGSNSGAVYVFERLLSGWTETHKLTGADPGAELGTSVATFGGVVIGGAPLAGAGAVFAYDLLGGGSPTPVRLDGVNVDSRFGFDVAMFGDTVIVGAPYDTVIAGLDRHGAAYAVHWDGAAGTFGTPQTLLDGPPGSNQRFGERVALQGNLALVGSPFFSLPVAVFERRGAEDWGPDGDADGGVDPSRMLAADAPQASSAFGGSVAVWGDTALVGASLHDSTSPAVLDAGAAFAFRLGAIDPPDPVEPLSLTEPAGGEPHFPLEPTTISWTGGQPDWTLEIRLLQLSPTTGVAAVLGAVANSSESYTWTLPSFLDCGPGDRYQFSIQREGDASTEAVGEDFELSCPPVLTFDSPLPGMSFLPGDPITVSWHAGAPLWQIDIRLQQVTSSSIALVGFVGTVPNAVGTLDWTIPADLDCGTGYPYRFHITPFSNFSYVRVSQTFHVPCPPEPLTLVVPGPSTVLPPGQAIDIAWTGGSPAAPVDLQLVEATSGTLVEPVAASLPNDGVRPGWPPFEPLACGPVHPYRFEIRHTGDAEWVPGPEFLFSCGEPFRFLGPEPDSEILPGEELTIRWGGGLDHWTVNLRLLDEATLTEVAEVASDLGNQPGELRWTLPPVLCEAGYVLKIQEARRFGPEPLASGMSEPFVVRCPDRVILTKVAETGQPLADGFTPVFFYGVALDNENLVFSSRQEAGNLLRTYRSPGCTTGSSEQCGSELVLGAPYTLNDLSADGGLFGGRMSSWGYGVGSPVGFDIVDVRTIGLNGVHSVSLAANTVAFSGVSSDLEGVVYQGPPNLPSLLFDPANLPMRRTYGIDSDGVNVAFSAMLLDGDFGIYLVSDGEQPVEVARREGAYFLDGGPAFELAYVDGRTVTIDAGRVFFIGETSRGPAIFVRGTTEPTGTLTTVVDRFSPTPDGVNSWIGLGKVSVDDGRIAFLATFYDEGGAHRRGLFLKDGEKIAKLFGDGDPPLGADWVVPSFGLWRDSLSGNSVGFQATNTATQERAIYVATLFPGGGVLQHLPDCPAEPDLDTDGLGDACDPDADGDGIENSIDGQLVDGLFADESFRPSTSFSDEGRGGVTFGTVVTNTGVVLDIRAGPQPSQAITVDALSGAGEASIVYCDDPVGMTDLRMGQWAGILCGSATVTANADPIEVALGDITVVVPNLVTVKVDQPTPEEPLEISNDIFSAAPGEVTVDDLVVTMPAASIAYLINAPNGKTLVENPPESLEPITVEVGGQTITYEPGARVALPVNIDIKPGSDENSINLGSKGSIPVGILSSATFDAATVDAAFVTLSSAPVKLKGKSNLQTSMEDVNGDGLLDQVVHVRTEDLGLSEGDTQATLEGRLYDGTAIRGADVIRVVP